MSTRVQQGASETSPSACILYHYIKIIVVRASVMEGQRKLQGRRSRPGQSGHLSTDKVCHH